MLLRTIILALAASLAAGAPAASVDSPAPASQDSSDLSFDATARAPSIEIIDSENTEVELNTRDDSGFVIQCFLATTCRGTKVKDTGYQWGTARGWRYAYEINAPANSPISCSIQAHEWSGELSLVGASNARSSLDHPSTELGEPKDVWGGGYMCVRGQLGSGLRAVVIAKRY